MNEFVKNNRSELSLLAFILGIGFCLRFFLLNTYYFMPENHSLYDFIVVKNILLSGDLSVAGRISSAEGFRYSPLYHYLILPVFYFFDNEFTGMLFFTLILNFMSLIIYFYIGKRSLKKPYYLLFCLLLVFAVYEITELLTLWALNCIPFFSSLALLALFKIVIDKDNRWFLLLGGALSCIVQMHAMGYFLLLYTMIAILMNIKNISQIWLCSSLWVFALLMIPNVLQQSLLFEQKSYYFLKAVFTLFNLGKYKDLFSHTPMEYFNAFFYFIGLTVVVRKKNKDVFHSENIAKFFRVLGWCGLAYIVIYGGDIFHIYIYRAFSLAVFTGIAVLLGKHYRTSILFLSIYVFLISIMLLGISFFGSTYFVDFRDRIKVANFFKDNNVSQNQVYNLSYSYKEEIIAGWYKHFMGGDEPLLDNRQDVSWVIVEGNNNLHLIMEKTKEKPFSDFGNIYLFKMNKQTRAELEIKLDTLIDTYLYKLTDFHYTMDEIEYLWKY